MKYNRNVDLGHSSDMVIKLTPYSSQIMNLLRFGSICDESDEKFRSLLSELSESETHFLVALEGMRLLVASAEMMRGRWDTATSSLLLVFRATENLCTRWSCVTWVAGWLKYNCGTTESEMAIAETAISLLRDVDVSCAGDWDNFLPLLVRLTERIAPPSVPMEAWLPLAIAFHGETGLLAKPYSCAELVRIGGAYMEDGRVFYEMHALDTWDARRLKTPFWQERGRQYIAAQEATGGPVDPDDFSPIRACEGDEEP